MPALEDALKIALLAGAGYLLGSIPVAWIVARLVTGRDLRDLGSGNVGVMNVALSVARWAGLFVLLSEAAKGVFAVLLAQNVHGGELAIGLTVLTTVVGTRWMVWLRFAGGRGNTAGAAAVTLLSWPTALIGAAIWALARLATRTSFWATRTLFAFWPLALGLLTRSWIYALTAVALSLIYLTTHKTGTDDHLLLKERWPSLWAFLTGPRRR